MTYLTKLLPYVKSSLMILFSKGIDTHNSQNALNSNLESISNWAYQ